MGCDIHLYQEVKIAGQWHCYNHPNPPRWYAVFGKMCGVRGSGDVQPIVSLRGLPEDLSVPVKLDAERWAGDGHSHTWFNKEEIAEFIQWIEAKQKELHPDQYCYSGKEYGYLFGSSWEAPHKYPTDTAPEIQDVRWVFWFDN